MKNKGKSFFNLSLFWVSLKSNYLSFLIVAFGNALLLFVVILILSSLTINVTRQSMTNLFNNASMERQIKEGAVSLYLSYDEGIIAYNEVMPTLGDSVPLLYDNFITVMKLNNGEYDTALNLIKTTYDGLYNSPLNTGTTEDEKHVYAKEGTIGLIEIFLPLFNLDSSQSEILPVFIDDFLDSYSANKSGSNSDLVKSSIKETIKTYLSENVALDESEINIVLSGVDDILLETDETKFDERARVTIDSIIDEIAKEQISYFTIDVPTEILLDGYINNKDAYTNNEIIEGDIGYKDKLYIEVLSSIMGTVFEDNYYLEALPTFTVEYLTNERGIPYYLDSNNEEVLIEDIKHRDKLVKVKDGMGKKANILEKQYKEILTGSAYTEKELNEAKADSKEFYDLGHDFVYNFLIDYVKNTSVYYDEESKAVNEEALVSKVGQDLKTYAEPLIKNMFDLESISDLTKDKYGLDGNELLGKVNDYAISSISVYKVEYKACLEKEYDERTSLLVSLVKASDTLTDQLPEDIYVKLYDLSSRNLYGLVIGGMFFSMAGLLLPIVYTILTSNSLVCTEVENGSLAFTLSSPIKRTTIIMTKAVYQLLAITLMFVILFLFGLCAREISIACGGDDFVTSFSIMDLCLYTLGAYLVTVAISGICFLASTIFNKTKYSIGVGGGLSIFFLVSSILGLFGLDAMPLALRIDSMNFFNYFTIIRLFDVQAVMDGNVIFYYKLIGLVLIALITYISSFIIFKKKDLPL